MTATELRNSETARVWLMQGAWLQRLSTVNPESVAAPLACAMTMAAADDPVPPLGFIADVIRLVESSVSVESQRGSAPETLSAEAIRSYEDYVLGKLYADTSFERACVAICRYEAEDRIRGIAWLLARLCERSGFTGTVISPSVARTLQSMPPDDVLSQGEESIQSEGIFELLSNAYTDLTNCIRHVGEVLSPEDVFELEHGTALIEFGQRLALRQTLRAAEEFATALPGRAPRPSSRQRNVPTHILEEDMYPIGGFTSISTRGTIESLLHSQLAYMEKDESRRPDLFEIKFLRSELLYYSRDENEFLRRRRLYQFVLFPDLVQCRIKDKEVRYQRIILILSSLVTLVRKLQEWLSDDALIFEFLFVEPTGPESLNDERELLELILAEQVRNGTVVFDAVDLDQIVPRAEEHARQNVTHCLILSAAERALPFDQAMPIGAQYGQRNPKLTLPQHDSAIDCESFADSVRRLVEEFA